MTCFRSRARWHRYVRKSLSAAEMRKMAAHLEKCGECRARLAAIQETADFLAGARVDLMPPGTIKINVMAAIDQTKYKTETGFPRLSQSSKQLGLSLLAAGLILLAINLPPVVRSLESGRISDPNGQIGRQIELPFTHLGEVLSVAVEKFGTISFGQSSGQHARSRN
ncbi:hypothetical protein CEB3_c26600 [Peptococcaceae bacterium CEB3]|nr:hypothetical protein CEB3_c26600 [Peptococcaceae bacterium CEB3]